MRTFPHTTALGWTYDSGDFEGCLDRALELVGDTAGECVGVGVALWVARSAGLYETASVKRDGEDVIVTVGSTPSGQGHETVFAQIAAATLGVDPERVTVRTGDTALLADGVGSFTARSTAMGGSAVVAAAEDLLAGGTATPGSPPTRCSPRAPTSRSSRSCARRARCACGGSSPSTTRAGSSTRCSPRGRWSARAVQGLGAALFEAVGEDPLDYPLPTAAEIPEFVTAFVESPSPLNPLGAKGISESGAIGAPAAIANAVADAIGRHLDPPLTPRRSGRALR